MATYDDLFGLRFDTALKNKVTVACVIAAEAIREEDAGTDNHANRLVWAKATFERPGSIAQNMLWALLAANKDADLAVITGASDAAIQTKVDDAVDLFATG